MRRSSAGSRTAQQENGDRHHLLIDRRSPPLYTRFNWLGNTSSPKLLETEDYVETNAHLLAALGSFKEPFIPVDIHSSYDGYTWTKLPTIDRIEVQAGKELHCDYIWSGELFCMDQIVITVYTSDGKVISSPVCMANRTVPPEKGSQWGSEHVMVTPKAREHLSATEVWYHLGGFSEESDSYDTQEYNFERELDRFWADLIGPDEHLRSQIVEAANRIEPEWKTVTITSNGEVTILFADGTSKSLKQPASPEPQV